MRFNNMDLADSRLFGTDGIRARAGEFPLDDSTVLAIGAALGKVFSELLERSPRFVIGRDTRESGDQIRSAVCTGAASLGAECEDAGVITTPGVAYITNRFDFDAGIVVSASHNPFEDNGLKFFLPSGKKLDEKYEREIERLVFSSDQTVDPPQSRYVENSDNQDRFADSYLAHLLDCFDGSPLENLKIAVDCANGAAFQLAPKLLARLGANVVLTNADPNGRNINLDCGSLHLEKLQRAVADSRADIGVAFDGDADRVLFVDESGEIVDGDATLWIIAKQLLSEEKLTNRKVVATVMSNIGLEIALAGIGVDLMRVNVGDKYVLEALLDSEAEVGGEQSGHIIIPEIGLVGDGLVTMVYVLRAMRSTGLKLSKLASGFVRYPQVLLNVSVAEKRPFELVERIASEKAAVEAELRGSGRLLLRYSGTENLARVMIEGKDQATIERQAHRLGAVIQNELGSSAG